MAQESSSQPNRGIRADFWWLTVLGLLLILNAVILIVKFMVLPSLLVAPDLGWLSRADPVQFWLGDILLLFLMCFLVGLLRGQITGKVDSARRISIWACLISGFVLTILPCVLSVVVSDPNSILLELTVGGRGVFLGLCQFVAGVGGAVLGGLIGRHFLRSPFPPGVQPLADTIVDDDQ